VTSRQHACEWHEASAALLRGVVAAWMGVRPCTLADHETLRQDAETRSRRCLPAGRQDAGDGTYLELHTCTRCGSTLAIENAGGTS